MILGRYLDASLRNKYFFYFFFSSRRRHTRLQGDWSSDVCSSDLSYNPPPHYSRNGTAGTCQIWSHPYTHPYMCSVYACQSYQWLCLHTSPVNKRLLILIIHIIWGFRKDNNDHVIHKCYLLADIGKTTLHYKHTMTTFVTFITYEGVILSYSCTFIVHCLHLRTGSFLFVAGQENWLSRRNIPCVTKPYRHMTYCQLRVHIHLHMSILSLHHLLQNMSEHNCDYRTCL